MFFNFLSLVAFLNFLSLTLAASPIGYLLTWYTSASSCPTSIDKSYKIVGLQMGVCTKVTPTSPDYAQSKMLTGCTSTSTPSYTQTLYMSTNCAANSVIRSESVYTKCDVGVTSSCTSNSAPWTNYKGGYLEM